MKRIVFILLFLALAAQAHGATFVSDTFTGADDATLVARTRSDGGSYTQVLTTGGASAILYVNQAVCLCNSGTYDVYTASGTPASAEYDIEAAFEYHSSGDASFRLMARYTNTSNYYFTEYDSSNGDWKIFKLVAGTPTQIGSTYNSAMGDNTDHTIKFEVRNATKKLFIDGVERISSADNALSTAGIVGFGWIATNSRTGGFLVDSITATDAAGGGGSTTLKHRRVQ